MFMNIRNRTTKSLKASSLKNRRYADRRTCGQIPQVVPTYGY